MTTKPLDELCVDDFATAPVWECRYTRANGLEARPTEKHETFYDHDSDSEWCDVVLTQFILSNGIELSGFCMPHEDCDPAYFQPTLFTNEGQVALFLEGGSSAEARAEALRRLGVSETQKVFPIRFTTRVAFGGKPFHGVVPAFDRCVPADQ